jgi:hypothetical protein
VLSRFAELDTGNAPFTPVLKSSYGPFREYLKPNDGFPMPDVEVVPVVEVDGLTNRYDMPIFAAASTDFYVHQKIVHFLFFRNWILTGCAARRRACDLDPVKSARSTYARFALWKI